jgi:hypothetical protein
VPVWERSKFERNVGLCDLALERVLLAADGHHRQGRMGCDDPLDFGREEPRNASFAFLP